MAGSTILINEEASLEAMILKITLYVTLQQAMGLKSSTLSASLDFGIRANTEWLICLRIWPDAKNSIIAALKSLPTMS